MLRFSYIVAFTLTLLLLVPVALCAGQQDPLQPYYDTYSDAVTACDESCNGEYTCSNQCYNRSRATLCDSVVAALAGNGQCEVVTSTGSWVQYCPGKVNERCDTHPADCQCNPDLEECRPGVGCVEKTSFTCGDNNCHVPALGGTEDCSTCPQDCQCAEGHACRPGDPYSNSNGCMIGVSEGTASKLPSCGDLECSPTEDCVDCALDCNCSALGGICDPSSGRRDQKMCAPKTAYIFVSNGLSSYHLWWTTDDQEMIRKRYASLGYTVEPTMDVNHINDLATYLSRPSVKAIAYFGHGEDPDPGVTAIPTIESTEATKGGYSIKSAVAAMTNASKGYRYTCQYETYVSKFTGANKDAINRVANERIASPGLDYAFLFACYSFEDSSLMDYLVRSGGTFWGYKGKLPGNAELTPAYKI